MKNKLIKHFNLNPFIWGEKSLFIYEFHSWFGEIHIDFIN